MKKLCEIYDISKEYQQPDNTLFVIVSDLSEKSLVSLFPGLITYSSQIMTTTQWNELLSVKKVYQNNEDKHRMRTLRKGVMSDGLDYLSKPDNEISTILENKSLSQNVKLALEQLSEISRKRFELYYFEHYTYRQIGSLENRNPKTIYESVKAAQNKFLSFFQNYPHKTPPTSSGK